MISVANARKWSKEAHDRKTKEWLDKWVVQIGDDWVQTFRDKMSQAMVDAVRKGQYEAEVTVSSPEYLDFEQRDKWQEFICPDLEKLLQEYEALGFQDGASEAGGVTYNTYYNGSYHVSIDWGYRQRPPHVKRVRYA